MNITYNQVISEIGFHKDRWNHNEYGAIIGITRGGLIPAVIASNYLRLPLITIKHQNYDGVGDISISEYDLNLLKQTRKVLLIDDIVDSGETLINIMSYLGKDVELEIDSYSIVYKPHTSPFKPTFHSFEHTGDDWVIFPWEA